MQVDEFKSDRDILESLFAQRATSQGAIGVDGHAKIRTTVDDALAKLKEHIRDFDTRNYLDARNFLTAWRTRRIFRRPVKRDGIYRSPISHNHPAICRRHGASLSWSRLSSPALSRQDPSNVQGRADRRRLSARRRQRVRGRPRSAGRHASLGRRAARWSWPSRSGWVTRSRWSRFAAGERVVKYGQTIGFATEAIAPGAWIHTHNLTAGSFERDYAAASEVPPEPAPLDGRTFAGYKRPDRKPGTRNYIAVISTVNCSASVSKYVAARFGADALEQTIPTSTAWWRSRTAAAAACSSAARATPRSTA